MRRRGDILSNKKLNFGGKKYELFFQNVINQKKYKNILYKIEIKLYEYQIYIVF